MSSEGSATRWIVATEFSTVVLTLLEHQGSTRVHIEDAVSGAETTIDALELEILARSTEEERGAFFRSVMQMNPPPDGEPA